MDEFDSISVKNIKNGLKTKFLGQNIVFFDKINSTNAKAKILSNEGATEGTLVIAEEQYAGRGRFDRAFYTPRGKGLWFSTILRPKFKTADAPKCTLLTAAAVALAIEKIGLTPQIKWPNDIMRDNKKLVGILTELATNKDGSYSVIIGAGINVNFSKTDFPENIREIATSLAIMKGEKINRAKLLQNVLLFMEELYIKAENGNFDETFNVWRKFSITLNKNIRVINAGDDKEIIGCAVDIDDNGALIVDVNGNLQKIFAGDVSIREMGNLN